MKRLSILAAAVIAILVTTSVFSATVVFAQTPTPTATATPYLADKSVTSVTLDTASNYPNAGGLIPTPTGTPGPQMLTIKAGLPQTQISVTSTDVLVSEQAGGPVLDSLVGFYADIPEPCLGRWYDPGNNFPNDIYTVNGIPFALPTDPAQYGTPTPKPTPKTQGDLDNNPSLTPPPPPTPWTVAGQTFEVDLHFRTSQYGITEAVGAPVPITRFFDFECNSAGTFVFWFCNKIEPLYPYGDPNYPPPVGTPAAWPGNNVACAPLIVNVTVPVGGVAEAADAGASALGATASGGSSNTTYAVIAGIAAGVVLLGAGGWYARRRWLS